MNGPTPIGATPARRRLSTQRQWRNAGLATCLVLILTACGGSSTGSDQTDRFVAGVNVTQLFAAPTTAELEAVRTLWQDRDVSAQGVTVEATVPITLGGTPATARVISHTVGGVRHYGAILTPDNAPPGTLPVLMYSHESNDGIDVDALLDYASLAFDDLVDQFVFVVPSFRSEHLTVGGTTYESEGDPSPWGHDVDDALALLNAAIATTPEADPERVGVLGFSRGATVGMLASIRDPRIDLVVAYYGPTDFLGPFVEELVIETLEGNPRDLPGVNDLNATLIQPLKDGERTIADVRSELIRRSPIHFAADLPQLQLHHSSGDPIVPVGETERL
ncbi:MAG TPA: dienelactone hydrolase family protein, partial [Acidobacteriota bacterium]|nr:dienelactone hydrolase family protein [Acidobacteriota bacterium]